MSLVRLIVVCSIAMLLSTSAATAATLRFQRLGEDRFVVSHNVKLGGANKAVKMAYKKAASLCVAAGFSYFEVLGQEVGRPSQYQFAGGTLQVRFKHERTEGGLELDCKENAEPRYVELAKKKLTKSKSAR